MTYDIATLLEQNLQGIFGEGDDARSAKVAHEILADDAVFIEPHGIYRGREEIVRIAGVIRAMHPTFQYASMAPAEDLRGKAGRLKWVAGQPGKIPVYAGTDFLVVEREMI